MIRSSVAAFYAWLLCLFYGLAGVIRRGGFMVLRLALRVRSEVEKDRSPDAEILFATEVA